MGVDALITSDPVQCVGSAVRQIGEAAGQVAAAASTGYLVYRTAQNLNQDQESYVTPDTRPAGSTVHADPLPVTSSSSTSFPLADGGPQTSIPPSTGVYNDTLNVLADPLPGVSPEEHIYKSAERPGHHTVPSAILKMLPPDVANHPAVRGTKGAPNIWPIPKALHDEIHRGPRGGPYNQRWREELEVLEHPPSVNDVIAIREKLVEEFGLGEYRP